MILYLTDYTCIPFWEETNCDYYITPHESLNGEIIKRGIKKEKLTSFEISPAPMLPPDTSIYFLFSSSERIFFASFFSILSLHESVIFGIIIISFIVIYKHVICTEKEKICES